MTLFKRVYLFPEVCSPQYRKIVSVKRWRDRKREKTEQTDELGEQQKPWHYLGTPLKVYAGPLGIDFEKILERKAKTARQQGKTIKILDVGCGDATQ